MGSVSRLVPRQATFAPSRRPARPLAAPAESPSTSSTRTSGRHTESTHRTPLLDGQTLPATALVLDDGVRAASRHGVKCLGAKALSPNRLPRRCPDCCTVRIAADHGRCSNR
ncbi:hypothetical protein F8144_39450 [Streptomyces triticiradicis]|uniref:Uncharacterized protein n=1 Tax=Streptomyces triticiradicis TaxID=2651189 RepID=A0A7J5D5I8_9ACTN|nr:hypothetical protein F8144_39450 [Streptomyces triticiradicis]